VRRISIEDGWMPNKIYGSFTDNKMRWPSKKIGIILVIAAGLLILAWFNPFSDRVNTRFKSGDDLSDSALTWLPFKRQQLSGATDIYLRTDVDTNQFIVEWTFNNAKDIDEFVAVLKQRAKDHQTMACKSNEIACAAAGAASGNVEQFVLVDDQSNVFYKQSYWLIGKTKGKIFGSNQLPPPPHLQ
jgi:hypothetical protein